MEYYDGGDYSHLFLITIITTLLITAGAGVVAWLVTSIALSMFFNRVGVDTWKAWIPFYNLYMWLRVGGQNGHWIWLALIPYASVVPSIFIYIGMWRTQFAFARGRDVGLLILGIFFPFVWLFIIANSKAEYRPELITAAGYPPPLAGYGSAQPPA